MPYFILDNLICAANGNVLIPLRVADLEEGTDVGLNAFDATVLWDSTKVDFVSGVNCTGTVGSATFSNILSPAITVSDPTVGGTVPNGDVVGYVVLKVKSGQANGTLIPLTVDDSGGNSYDMFAPVTNDSYTLDPYQAGSIIVSSARPSASLWAGDVTGSAGGQVTVPINYSPVVAGGPGIDGGNVAILFDPNFIDQTTISIAAGSLVNGVSHTPVWTGVNNVDPNKFSMGLNWSGSVVGNRSGSIWLVTFALKTGISGKTALLIAISAKTGTSLTTTTNLTDLSGLYALCPKPATITVS